MTDKTQIEIVEKQRMRLISMEDIRSSKKIQRLAFGPNSDVVVTPDAVFVSAVLEKGDQVPLHYHDFRENLLIISGSLIENATGRKIAKFAQIPPYTYHALSAEVTTTVAIQCSMEKIPLKRAMALATQFAGTLDKEH